MIGIGIDVGGTYVKFLAVDESGKTLKQDQIPTRAEEGPKAFIEKVAAFTLNWQKEFKGRPMAVGMGIAGEADPEKGHIHFAPNLNKWRNVSISEPFEKMTGMSCVLENDANMAGWGAYDWELKRKYRNVLAVTLGTGVGGGIVLDGKMFHGGSGAAGEIGHIKVVPEGELCNCGSRGCVEAYAGNYAICRRTAQSLEKAPPKSLLKRICAEEGVSTLSLFKAAEQGDPLALRIWEETGTYLARGLASVCLVLNPDAVVLTGGVSRASKFFLRAINEEFGRQTIVTPFKHLKLVVAETSNLGSIGAAMFGMEWNRARKTV